MNYTGKLSNLRPCLAEISRTRGWSQRTTPLVWMPVIAKANPFRLANSPPVVMGQMMGSFVYL
jgi:hypothetical protein